MGAGRTTAWPSGKGKGKKQNHGSKPGKKIESGWERAKLRKCSGGKRGNVGYKIKRNIKGKSQKTVIFMQVDSVTSAELYVLYGGKMN
jgi:hypothetical protein